MNISLDQLSTFGREVFRQAGLSQADAATATDTLLAANSWGIHTHGLKNLGGYVKRLNAGGAKRRNLVDLGTLLHQQQQNTRRKTKTVNAENMALLERSIGPNVLHRLKSFTTIFVIRGKTIIV